MAKIKRNWYNYYRGSKKLRKARMVQTDNAKVTIKTSQVVTANYDEVNRTGVAAINVYDVLASNPLFNSQKANYDQVKINYVSAKITCTDVGTSLSNANSVKSYNVYTAWDRTGLSLDQFLCYSSSGSGNADRWITKVGNYIANYSSSQKKALNSFQRFTESQYIAPNDVMERCNYVSTGDIIKFSGSQFVNENSLPREILIGITDTNALLTVPFVTTPNENPNCRWKPTLLIGVFSNSLPDAQSQVSVVNEFGSAAKCVFNVDFSINVTFRGLKASLENRDEDGVLDRVESLKIVNLNQWFDEKDVSPSNGYDTMKKVRLINNLPSEGEEFSREYYLSKIDEISVYPDQGYSMMREVIIKPSLWLSGILNRFNGRYQHVDGTHYRYFGFDEFNFVPEGGWKWSGFNQSMMFCAVYLVNSMSFDDPDEYGDIYLRVEYFIWLDQIESDPHWHFVHVPNNSYIAKWFMGYDDPKQYLSIVNQMVNDKFNVIEKDMTKWFVPVPASVSDSPLPPKPKNSYWYIYKDYPIGYFDAPDLDNLDLNQTNSIDIEPFMFLSNEEIVEQDIRTLPESSIPDLSNNIIDLTNTNL